MDKHNASQLQNILKYFCKYFFFLFRKNLLRTSVTYSYIKKIKTLVEYNSRTIAVGYL